MRPYVPGDDVRRIEWNVTARTGETHVRVDLAERVLVTWLALDVSASMSFGTAERRKADVAEGVALALGHLASRRGNRLGLVSFGDGNAQAIPPRQGRAGMLGLLLALRREPVLEGGGATSLGDALGLVSRLARQRSFVAVVSDFRGPRDWRTPLLQLAGRPRRARGRDPRPARGGAAERGRAPARRPRDRTPAARRHGQRPAARALRRRRRRGARRGRPRADLARRRPRRRSRPRGTGCGRWRVTCAGAEDADEVRLAADAARIAGRPAGRRRLRPARAPAPGASRRLRQPGARAEPDRPPSRTAAAPPARAGAARARRARDRPRAPARDPLGRPGAGHRRARDGHLPLDGREGRAAEPARGRQERRRALPPEPARGLPRGNGLVRAEREHRAAGDCEPHRGADRAAQPPHRRRHRARRRDRARPPGRTARPGREGREAPGIDPRPLRRGADPGCARAECRPRSARRS